MAQIEFNKAYVLDLFEKYFDTDADVVERALCEKKINDDGKLVDVVDKQRLQAILEAITPYCGIFIDKVDSQRKKKVGKKLLCIGEGNDKKSHTMKYDGFFYGESYNETRSRLDGVYDYTTAKGINIYNIIGQTMLIESNLYFERDKENKTIIRDAYEWAPRMVWNIYEAVREFGFDEKETATIFEKAKTIFSKGMADNIKSLCYSVSEGYFSIRKQGKKYEVLNENDFKKIIKKCSTILVDPKEKLKVSFDYLVWKTEENLENLHNLFDFEGEERKDDAEIVVEFVKKIIMETPNLLQTKVSQKSEKVFSCDKIENAVRLNLMSFLQKDLGYELVDERDRMSEAEELEVYGDVDMKKWEKENGFFHNEEQEDQSFKDFR